MYRSKCEISFLPPDAAGGSGGGIDVEFVILGMLFGGFTPLTLQSSLSNFLSVVRDSSLGTC